MKFIQHSICAVILLALVACDAGKSPKKTAQKFLNAFNEKNYEEARKYSTAETIKLIDLMENLSKMASDLDTVKHGKIEVINEIIEGETATVTFREAGEEGEEELKLKKVDGKWLVHITKADMSTKSNSAFNTNEEGVMMEHDSLFEMSGDSTILMPDETE